MPYLEFLILALCCGAISLTLTKGTIFLTLRDKVSKRSKFFGELLACPYCTSHWVAAGAMAVMQPRMVHTSLVVADYGVTWFALVALSAVTAGTIFKLFSSK